MGKNQHRALSKRSKMTPSDVCSFMDRHGLDNNTLADAIGVTNSAVVHWRNGTRKVPEVEVRVMRLFDANPAFIDFFKTLGGTR